MGSLQADSEEKQEMDDSGCIQDESPPAKRCENGTQGVQLLDLSDDVLLLILRFLTPRDLKALGYTCPRLGALILDRSLWQAVDARGQPWGRARLRWYLSHALHAGTRQLLLSGYAREARECLGHVNQTREEIETAKQLANNNGKENNNNSEPAEMETEQSDSQSGTESSQSPRVIDVPFFIENGGGDSPEAWAWPRPSDPLISDSKCPGPQFTLTHCVLRQLADTCPALVSLGLEYCNINCNTTSISQFPPTLKTLSMRGSKCYNLPLDRSFLFKIQDTLPGLEVLDVSECEWMEPASLLPLSKLPNLKHLFARDCLRLTEFVAYASLATRYGFTKLEWLDLRGSPVGDSEVSALGWLSRLTHLWLSPAVVEPQVPQHSHHKCDSLPSPSTPPEDKWEAQEPYYYKIKEPQDYKESHKKTDKWDSDESRHTWRAENGENVPTTSNAGQCSKTISPQQALSSKKALTPTKPPTSKTTPLSPTDVPSTSKSSPSCNSKARSPNGSSNGPSTSNGPDSSKAPKRKRSNSPTPGPSKRRRDDDSDSSDDDNVPLKTLIQKEKVNEGASTSKNEPTQQAEPAQQAGPAQEDIEAEPRHHVLYVNVGQQLHAVYRLSLDNEHRVSFNRNSNRRLNTRILLSPPGAHLDASSLITDSAIRRFGRADGENVNYVHIGPNGPYASVLGSRPDRSSLTHLTVTGFRHITDRSLEHLATSAPHLQFLDFSETRVTDAGVASFRSLRPDCEVRYSKYVDQKED